MIEYSDFLGYRPGRYSEILWSISARPTGAYRPLGVPFRTCTFFWLEAQVEGKNGGKKRGLYESSK